MKENSNIQRCEDDKHESTVKRAISGMPNEQDLQTMCSIFKVLSEPSRMKIILALAEGEMCVYHITQAVQGQQSAVSHQLRILRDNKILKSRRDGKNILYSISDNHVEKIIEMSKAHLNC